MPSMTMPSGWLSTPQCDLCEGKDFTDYLERGADGALLTQCDNCGLVLLNPRPDAAGVAAWYSEDYFTAEVGAGMGAQYLDYADAGIQHGTEGFFQFARRVKMRGLKLLEVGCGGGAFLVQCRNAGAEVAGLEISKFAAARLQQKYGLNVQIGIIDTAPFEPASFDIVTFTDVIEHVLSPAEFLTGIHRLLKPGGKLFGLLPNLDCVTYYGQNWAGFRLHPEHLYYFGRSQLERYLSKTGFRVREMWTWGDPWEPDPAGVAPLRRSVGWPGPLRQAISHMPLLRAARRIGVFHSAARSVRAWISPEVRKRHARYRAGLGHDLCFIATKI